MKPVSDAERDRMKAALARLEAVVSDVASDVLARVHERCPYRARGDRCTFRGGCVNQRREGKGEERTIRCGGDHQLRRAKR